MADVVTTRAILLRSHPYSESSRVLRFYARDLGLVGVMARGARRRGSGKAAGAGTFSEGIAVIAFSERRELQSLQEFAPARIRLGLGRDLTRLAGASVAAELVLGHAGQEPNPELYDFLSGRLDRMEKAEPHQVAGQVLALCWRIVRLLGFEPELASCTACGLPLDGDAMARFDLNAGGVRCDGCSAGTRAAGPGDSRRIGPVAREQLADLLRGDIPTRLRGEPAHLSLLDDFAAHHMLGGRRLASFRSLVLA